MWRKSSHIVRAQYVLFERLKLALSPSWMKDGVSAVRLLAVEYDKDNNTTPLSLYNYLFTRYKALWPHHLIWPLLPTAPTASYYYSPSQLRNPGSEQTPSRCHNNQTAKPRFKIQSPRSTLHYCKYHTSLNHPVRTLCQNTFLKINSDGIFQCVDLTSIYPPT